MTITFLICALLGWLGGFLMYWLLHKLGVMDVPNVRSSHDEPVVRGGGLAILLVLAIWFIYSGSQEAFGGFRLAIALALVAVISFVDDLKPLPFWLRLAIHGAGAAIVLSSLDLSVGSLPALLAWAVPVVAWFWIVGYTNAFNFMDGINGLAAMQGLVTCLFGALFCHLSADAQDSSVRELILVQLVLAGALAGFLPHNFPKARMFLGDVGSVSIGFSLTVFVVAVWALAGWKAGLALGALHLNFLLDTIITMTRRALRHERIHEAHKEHFYQRLNQGGKSHFQVTGLETVLQVLSGLLLVLTLAAPAPLFIVAVAAVAVIWLLFFGYAEKKFRQAKVPS